MTQRSEARRRSSREETRHQEALLQARRLGIATLTVAAVAGLVVVPTLALINYLQAHSESLEVQSWSVGYTSHEETVSYPPDTSTLPHTGTAAISTLDIAVRNRGTVASLITGTELTVTSATQPEYCAAIGGPLGVAEAYEVVLPSSREATPLKLVSEQRFTVEAGTNDRYQILVAPDTRPSVPALYTAEIVILHDGGERLPVGSVAFLSPPYNLTSAYNDLTALRYDGTQVLGECRAAVARSFAAAIQDADQVAADLACYADLYQRAGEAMLAGSEQPSDTCAKMASPIDETLDGTSSGGPSDQSGASGDTPAPDIREEDLLAAPVPSLCEHPAGTLVDGSLPGLGPSEGYVEMSLGRDASGTAGSPLIADLNGDNVMDAVAVFRCSTGGVAWPDSILVYGPGPTLLAYVDMSTVYSNAHVTVTRLWIENGDLHADWQTSDVGGPPFPWTGRLALVGDRLVVEEVNSG